MPFDWLKKYIQAQIAPMESQLTTLKEDVEKFMENQANNQAALDAAIAANGVQITNIKTQLLTLGTSVAQYISDVQTFIGKITDPTFATEIAALQQQGTDLTTIAQGTTGAASSIATADATVNPPAATTSTTPATTTSEAPAPTETTTTPAPTTEAPAAATSTT